MLFPDNLNSPRKVLDLFLPVFSSLPVKKIKTRSTRRPSLEVHISLKEMSCSRFMQKEVNPEWSVQSAVLYAYTRNLCCADVPIAWPYSIWGFSSPWACPLKTGDVVNGIGIKEPCYSQKKINVDSKQWDSISQCCCSPPSLHITLHWQPMGMQRNLVCRDATYNRKVDASPIKIFASTNNGKTPIYSDIKPELADRSLVKIVEIVKIQSKSGKQTDM